MAKFYVQSGNFRTTINAVDAEKAALWAVHKVMEQVLPFQDDLEIPADQKSYKCIEQGLMVLGETMQISQLGFDSADQTVLDTLELQIHWHQLTIALARLESMISPSSSDSRDQALCELVA